jgi:hypothetical protein
MPRSWSGIVIIAALLMPAVAVAAPGPPADTWVPNGTVNAIAVSGRTAFLGGDFDRIGPYTGGSVRIDATTAQARTPWPEVDGAVDVATPDGAGGWFLGGDFAEVGGQPRAHLAHVRADGSLDPAWRPTTDGIVRALVVSGGLVYAGGSFTTANGTPHSFLAAFDATSGTLAAVPFEATNATQHFCVGGDSVDGVQDLEIGGTPGAPVLYVAGIFDTVKGAGGTSATRNNLASFSLTSQAVTGFDPNFRQTASQYSGPVYSISLSGGALYAGGCFLYLNGTTLRQGVAKLDPTTGLAAGGWNAGSAVGTQVAALDARGNRVYVVASGLAGGADVLALNTIDGASDASWQPPSHDPSGIASDVVATDSAVYVAGSFVTDAPSARRNLVAFSVANGAPTAWQPEAARDVKDIAVNGDEVVAGGTFEVYGGIEQHALAALDLDTGRPTAVQPPIARVQNLNLVEHLAVGDGLLWAAGYFVTQDSAPANRLLAAFDLPTLTQTSFAREPANTVQSLVARGRDAYVGGNFSQVGGVTRHNVALVHHAAGTAGDVLRFDADVDGPVRALALRGDRVYLGGAFTKVNTITPRANLAAVDAASGDLLPFDAGVDGVVDTLHVAGDTVFAGGPFAPGRCVRSAPTPTPRSARSRRAGASSSSPATSRR